MINLYKSEFSLLQQEIFKFLSMHAGVSFNARDLAKSLHRTQAGIVKVLSGLEEKKLIKIKKDKYSGRWSIEFNQDSSKATELKRVENLRVLYESGLINFLEESFPGATIILFGSYSRGEDVWSKEDEGHKSDVDIAIIGVSEKKVNLKKFEELLKREILINFYPSFKEIHKNLKENLLNGILFSGGIEL